MKTTLNIEVTKKFSLLDAVHFIAKSWQNVKMATIYVNCFKKGGFLQVHDDLTDLESIDQVEDINDVLDRSLMLKFQQN